MGIKKQKPVPKMCAKYKNSKKNVVVKTQRKRRKRVKKEIDWEQYRKEAERRTAWGHYMSQMSYIRAVEEENELQEAKYRGNDKKVKEIEDKRKNRNTNMLYIS